MHLAGFLLSVLETSLLLCPGSECILNLPFRVLIHLCRCDLKLVSVTRCLLFGILTCASLYFQKVSSSRPFFPFLISLLYAPESIIQIAIFFFQGMAVIFQFYLSFTNAARPYFQWRLFISNQNAHHIMIGTSLLSASVLSNIQDSNDHHPGVCMPCSCLLSRFNSYQGFRSGVFPIQTFRHS